MPGRTGNLPIPPAEPAAHAGCSNVSRRLMLVAAARVVSTPSPSTSPLNGVVGPKPDYTFGGWSKRLRLAPVDGATPNAALLIAFSGGVTANNAWSRPALPWASRMPSKVAVIGNGVYVNAASLEVFDSLWSQRISVVPNLACVVERRSIIDGRGSGPTAPRHERTRRQRGAAVEKGDRFPERASLYMAHEFDGSPPRLQPRQFQTCLPILIANRSRPPHRGQGPINSRLWRLSCSPSRATASAISTSGTIAEIRLRASWVIADAQ